MDWVFLNVIETLRRADIVSQTTNRCLMSSHIVVLPLTKKSHNEVSSELACKNLSEEVDVGNEGGLKNNRNVRCVEKLDWVWLLETSHLSAGKAEFNTEALEVDDNEHDDRSGEEVAKIRGILPIERLLQAVKLVWFCDQEMESGNDSTLEFGSLVSSNGNWGEGLPEDGLADVSGNEEGDT